MVQDLTGPYVRYVHCNFLTVANPLAPEELVKLREVLEQQFSLEILLKNEERKAIEAEKAKVETSIKQLEQCIVAGGIAPFYCFNEKNHIMKARIGTTTTMVNISSMAHEIQRTIMGITSLPYPLDRSAMQLSKQLHAVIQTAMSVSLRMIKAR
jgi:hypothetical protein